VKAMQKKTIYVYLEEGKPASINKQLAYADANGTGYVVTEYNKSVTSDGGANYDLPLCLQASEPIYAGVWAGKINFTITAGPSE